MKATTIPDGVGKTARGVAMVRAKEMCRADIGYLMIRMLKRS
jgi:hypothetical protein